MIRLVSGDKAAELSPEALVVALFTTMPEDMKAAVLDLAIRLHRKPEHPTIRHPQP